MLEALESRVMCSGVTYLLNGDINRDGIIDRYDAAIMYQMAVHEIPVNLLADLSGDDKVTGFDASLAMWMDIYKMPEPFQGRILEYKIPDGETASNLPAPLNAGVLRMAVLTVHPSRFAGCYRHGRL